jgi:hypothetical protein
MLPIFSFSVPLNVCLKQLKWRCSLQTFRNVMITIGCVKRDLSQQTVPSVYYLSPELSSCSIEPNIASHVMEKLHFN